MSKNKSVKIRLPKDMKKSIDSIADEFVGIVEAKTDQTPDVTQKPSIESFSKPQLELIEESRFTIVIPSYLHTRIKKYCAINSVSIKDALTEILLKEFPES